MRYFLDKHGRKTFRIQGKPGEGHVEIAREVLARHEVTPKDEADHYEQMFRLKYVRVVEHDGRTLEIESRGKLTTGQQRHVNEMEREGWKIIRLISAGSEQPVPHGPCR